MNLASEDAMRIWNRGTNVTGFGIVNNAPDGKTAIKYATPGWSNYFANAVTIYKPVIEKAISEGYTALVFEYYTPDATFANIEGYTVAPVYQTPITQNSWTTISCDLSRIGDMADVGLGDNFRIAVGDSGTFYISNMYFVK